ncbi:MAG: class I SAM-dependent methyltransferase [Kangiellaceae bacterium]
MKLKINKIILGFVMVGSLVGGLSVQAGANHSKKLTKVLASQPDEAKMRYDFRHPQETIEFFGVKPGMKVLEALPGGGWYTKILLPYLGNDGSLIGVDYELDMYPKFGFFSKERLKEKETWVQDWTKKANGWKTDKSANIEAYTFGNLSPKLKGKLDAVLFIRALHNLARFESDGGYLTTALNDAYNALKPGGIVGVVQHQLAESADDKGADGSRGYLKKSFLIGAMKKAGFELVAESDINLNPKDKPNATDIVWRLPPSYVTSRKDETKKAEYTAIGESNRMTLKFRKPKK